MPKQLTHAPFRFSFAGDLTGHVEVEYMRPCHYWLYLSLEQKRLYRRNLTYSWLIVASLVAIALIAGVLIQQESREIAIADFFMNDEGSKARPCGRGGTRPVASSFLRGGFVEKPSVIPDQPMHDAAFTISADFTAEDLPLPDPNAGAPPVSFSSIDGSGMTGGFGGDADFGLPAEPGLARSWLTMPDFPTEQSLKISENRDGVIIASDIPWPGNAALDTDTGRVVVDITIQPNATISYDFVSAEPAGKGFRRVTERAIVYGFKNKPRIVRGVAVESQIRLSVTFCLGCESSIVTSNLEGFQVAMD